MFREYESDELLVQLVAIQHISLKLNGIFNETNDYTGSSGVSLRMFIKSMQGELDNFKRNLSFELQHHRKSSDIDVALLRLTLATADILCYCQSVEIGLWEIGLSYAFSNEEDTAYRISILYSFLMAVKTFLSTHFSHGYPHTAARAYITSVQCEYAIRMGIKILRIPATDGWDSDHARIVLDFPSVMEMATSKIEAIIRVRALSGEQQSRSNDVFAQHLNNMRCLKNWSQSLDSSGANMGGGSAADFSHQRAQQEQQALEPAEPNTQSFTDGFLMMTNSDSFIWEALNCQNDDWMALGRFIQ